LGARAALGYLGLLVDRRDAVCFVPPIQRVTIAASLQASLSLLRIAGQVPPQADGGFAMQIALSRFGVCAALLLAMVSRSLAADPVARSKSASAQKTIELFAGMKAGDVEAKLIPTDSTEGMLTIKNQTAQPLTIKLPEVFAAVPVLAQR